MSTNRLLAYSIFVTFVISFPGVTKAFDACSTLSGQSKVNCDVSSKECTSYTSSTSCESFPGGNGRCYWDINSCYDIGKVLKSNTVYSNAGNLNLINPIILNVVDVSHVEIEYTNCKQWKVNLYGRSVGCDTRKRTVIDQTFSPADVTLVTNALNIVSNNFDSVATRTCLYRNMTEFYTNPANIFTTDSIVTFFDAQMNFLQTTAQTLSLTVKPFAEIPNSSNQLTLGKNSNVGTIVFNPQTASAPTTFKSPGYRPPTGDFTNLVIELNVNWLRGTFATPTTAFPGTFPAPTAPQLADTIAHEIIHQMGHVHVGGSSIPSQFAVNDLVYEFGHCIQNQAHFGTTVGATCISTNNSNGGTIRNTSSPFVKPPAIDTFCDHGNGIYLVDWQSDTHFLAGNYPEYISVLRAGYQQIYGYIPSIDQTNAMMAKYFSVGKIDQVLIDEIYRSVFGRPSTSDEYAFATNFLSQNPNFSALKGALLYPMILPAISIILQ